MRVEEISARDKRALLTDLLRQRARKPGSAPLSFAQQRLWFLDQLEPGSSLYNVHSAVSLHGQLDVVALERSFDFLVRRHETLRTTFEIHNGQPIQVISPEPGLIVAHADLNSSAINTMLEEEALRPFDLATGPLLR